jgi:hypothetical protein
MKNVFYLMRIEMLLIDMWMNEKIFYLMTSDSICSIPSTTVSPSGQGASQGDQHLDTVGGLLAGVVVVAKSKRTFCTATCNG